MATTDGGPPGAGELESLLPWHVTGTLSLDAANEIKRALARSPDLACQLELIRQEQAETVRLNESLATPSARPIARLLAAIATEKASKRAMPSLLELAARVLRR